MRNLGRVADNKVLLIAMLAVKKFVACTLYSPLLPAKEEDVLAPLCNSIILPEVFERLTSLERIVVFPEVKEPFPETIGRIDVLVESVVPFK